jgi:hypothetical protein
METAILVGIFGLLSTVLGAAVSHWATGRMWRREQAVQLLDDLARLDDIVFDRMPDEERGTFASKLRFRLVALGVPKADADELASSMFSAAESFRNEPVDGPDGEIGISSADYRPFADQRDAIVNTLVR